MYNWVQNAQWTAVFVSIFVTENRVNLYNVVDICKFSGVSQRRRKTIARPVVWKKLLRNHLSHDADKKLQVSPICSKCQILICEFILLTFCIFSEINEMLKKERLFTAASGNKICCSVCQKSFVFSTICHSLGRHGSEGHCFQNEGIEECGKSDHVPLRLNKMQYSIALLLTNNLWGCDAGRSPFES